MGEKLAEMHLADLHARAAELGVPRYRLLRRDDLVAAVSERGGDADVTEPEADDREGRERGGTPGGGATPEGERGEGPETEAGGGVLEAPPRRYGFLRFGGREAQTD